MSKIELDDLGSIASTTSSTQSLVALLQSYASGMGLYPSVLALASLTSPDDMLWLEPRQMERLNLLTSRNFKDFAEWSLQPSGRQLLASARQEQVNGRKTGRVVDCHYLHIGFEVTSDRIDEIAASIRGARHTLANSTWSYPLTIANVSARDDVILVSRVY